MYKIIHDDIIIDVLKELRYVRYIPQLKKVALTGAVSAQGICGSSTGTYYALPNVSIPTIKSHWKVVDIVEISPEEYSFIVEAMSKGITLSASSEKLLDLKNAKILELSAKCHDSIINGIEIRLESGRRHHFRLTLEDQINLMEIERLLNSGATSIIYHSTGNECSTFSTSDIKRIILACNKHKFYHTTYFNLLKNCISNMIDVKSIKSLTYGDPIPDMAIREKFESMIESYSTCKGELL